MAARKSRAAPAPLELRFASGDADCSASFYQPAGEGPFPTLIMGHGLGALRGMRLPAYAERFVAAGYACLLFDYRHFGESGGMPRQLLDIQRQLQDWASAIACARARPEVDANRIILWGTSFGGGHVLATAANDSKIAAVISQCPFTDGPASILAMDPIASAKVTALALRDRIGALLGAEPVMVAIAGHSGDTALMTAADAYEGYLGLVPEELDHKNYVAARIALEIVLYRPGSLARRITAPVLYCVCDSDTVAPAKATLRHAERTPNKEIRRYADGHFDIYVGEAFEQVVSDQLDFLQRTVPAH